MCWRARGPIFGPIKDTRWDAWAGREDLHVYAAFAGVVPISTSMDACIALMEMVLPGWGWTI